MSTRSMLTFIGDDGIYNVYNHSDGYPSGIAEKLQNATKLAWELPRFESDEFAAAFVAANKEASGGIRFYPSGKNWKKFAGFDLDYRYEISRVDTSLHVKAYEINFDYPGNRFKKCSLIFEGTLQEFCEFVNLPMNLALDALATH